MMPPSWGDEAVRMARSGMTIAKIHKELKADYWDVWNHVRSTQGTEWSSWHGAKWIFTNRLNRLVSEKDPAKRQDLKNEAAECANYFYYEMKRLRGRVDRARKALGT